MARAMDVGLTEAALLAEARQATGLERFGDESFLPALRILLAGLCDEANLNDGGRMRAKGAILMSLKNRLWANACFERHPEILQRKVAAPLVILGPARSGTTRLQRMLSADPRLQHLTAWEGFNPAPRPGLPGHGGEQRHAEVKAFLDQRRRSNPESYTAHPMDADWAEEETLLLNHSFCGFYGLAHFNMPTYRAWYLASDKADSYRYMAQLIKLIAWTRGIGEGQPWVLKAPPHMLALDALLGVFPDARLVFTHRDPVKTTGSTMSLVWSFYRHNTDAPSREAIRDSWLPICERMARDCMEARVAIPAGQQLDVQYADMNRDWRSVMRRVYAFAGLAFDTQTDALLTAWQNQSDSENHHGGHRYSLEDFGTSAEEVGARMRFYQDRYVIPCEGQRA
jgi:hypothetical protein